MGSYLTSLKEIEASFAIGDSNEVDYSTCHVTRMGITFTT
jgi:hypothetical protein